MKLNLGCGRKPRLDYTNVDIILPEGFPEYTFVQDDVTELSKFDRESADEITASHLIEHLPPFLVEKTLYQWLRVLKPGGILIMEQPDLVKCCINFLQLLTTGDPNMINRLGIIGIYGEQMKAGDFMAHRWGYWPESLASIVSKVGFVDVKTTSETQLKPAHIKGRDFRLTARKPL